jgi:pentatricopeptide repeat protein
MELKDRVQESLSGTHTIERELGGGGMSRVFVALERRLGRRVVVKVLAPELAAAMSAERFEREIQLSASLQQANIVPIIAAGDLDGLPDYTMPFVDGESLRARLAHGPVQIDTAIDILRDVAKALAYAHDRGVVHRDIKPDNILLAGRSAVVADFGIAKAIAAAQERPVGATLTQLGTAVGTPAYMAPEQAAGDPSTDNRADLYAFGCVAYELLAGHPPFHGLSPHKLMAAHMAEMPRPIEELRPDCPPALARLIARCLAKDPARRPENADEVLRELATTTSSGAGAAMPFHGRSLFLRAMAIYAAAFIGVAIVARLLVETQGLPEWIFTGALMVMALGFPVVLFTGYTQYVARRVAQATPTLTPRGTLVRPSADGTMAQLAVKASPHVSWGRTARGGIAALTAFALLVAGYLVLRVLGIGPSGSLMAAGKLTAQDKVLVATFDAAGRDSALGDVVAVAVRTNLAQSRAVQLVPTSAIVAALERMQRPATSRVDLALARDIAQREGIKAVVAGNVASAGSAYIITARLVSAASGDELAVYQESAASAADIIPAVDRLTKQLRGRIGESLRSVAAAPPLGEVATSSLDALKSYAAGMRANDVEGDFPKAIPLFEDAIRKDTGFAAAYVQLAITLGNAGLQRARQDSLVTAAYRLRARLPERERYDVEGAYFFTRDRAKSIAAFDRALAIDSSDVDALNSLAILSLRTRNYTRSIQAARRTLAVEPGSGILWNNLAVALFNAGKFDAADSVYREMKARKIEYPSDREEAMLLYLRGEIDSVEARARAGVRSPNAGLSRRSLGMLRLVTQVHGRLRESDSLNAEMRARNAARGEPPVPLRDAVRKAYADALLRDRPQQAVAGLDSATRAVLTGSAMPADRLLDLTAIYALAGAPDKARSALKQADAATPDTAERRRLQGQRTEAEGRIALAERRTAEAIRLFRQSDVEADGLPQDCPFCLYVMLGFAYDQANEADSTIANLERYLSTPTPFRVQTDRWMMAPAHKRLGELYEARGDAKRAAEHYATFVELWKRADPDLQPKVTQVRMRLAALRRTLPQ